MLEFLRVWLPVIAFLLIVAALSAGTAMSFKANSRDHFGGV